MKPEHHDTHLTVTQAAKIIGVGRDAILMHIHRGRLPAIKDPGRTGRRWISPVDLSKAYPGYARHAKGPRGPLEPALTAEQAREWLNDEPGDDYLALPAELEEAKRRNRQR